MKKMLLFLSLITASLVYGMEECVNKIQQNPLLLFPKEREAARDRARTFAMALHRRLGVNSPANHLPQELVKKITTMARNDNAVVNEWLEQNQNEIERLQNTSHEEKDNALTFYADDYINPVLSIRILLYAGVNPNRANQHDEVPLNGAAYFGHKEVVQILLAANANPNIANNVCGMTPLNNAAYCGHKEVVQILLDANANPNIANQCGITSLHDAARFGHKEVVQILLAAGADRTMRNMKGMTAAETARDRGRHDIADLIEQWNPDSSPNQNNQSSFMRMKLWLSKLLRH